MSPHDVTARNGDIDLYVDLWGDTGATVGGSPVILIAGLGEQLTWWPPGFVHAIAIAGFEVVRFDNRDTGRSSHLEGTVSLARIRRTLASGGRPDTPYHLSDMAADVIAVADAVGADSVHVVGISMGGMIAQEAALSFPDRVRSLTSIMSTTGNPAVGQSTAASATAMLRGAPPDLEFAVATRVETGRLVATPGLFDPEAARWRITEAHRRSFDPAGVGRQYGAVLAAGDRTARLRTLQIPSLVIHGDTDPLVDVSGGRATAAAIPDARYIEIPGLAHDLPEPYWPQILDPLLTHLAAT